MPHYLILAFKTKQKQNNRENNPQRVVQDVASMPHQTPIQSTFPVFMLIPQINKEPKHGRNQQKNIYIYISKILSKQWYLQYYEGRGPSGDLAESRMKN